jgi:uncharacterized phosphosugar-binding protein
MEFYEKYPAEDTSYLDICKEFLEEIEKREAANFKRAGAMMAERIMQGEVVFAVGCGGHSYIPPMDMFCRAGSLVPISATLDVSTTTTTGGFRSVFLERVPGYMSALLRYFRVKKDDVVIIFNNVGMNALTIDAALECGRIGAATIGVAGSPWQDAFPPDHPIRHPSGKNLRDLVDVYIDDYNPVGDSVLKLEGLDYPMAPISTITDGYIVRRMEIEAVKYMLDRGHKPPLWVSANLPKGDEINQGYIDAYYDKVKLM